MADITQLAKEWWLLAVLGVVSLVCGVLAIVYPDVTLLAVGIIFGFYLLMAGVFELVEAVVGDPASRALSAIVGIVALIAGLICLRRPGDSLLAHTTDESVPIADLVAGCQAIAVAAMRFCGVAPSADRGA